jgi:hypothetical protein
LNGQAFELAAREIADSRPVVADEVCREERMAVRDALHDGRGKLALGCRIEAEPPAQHDAVAECVRVFG